MTSIEDTDVRHGRYSSFVPDIRIFIVHLLIFILHTLTFIIKVPSLKSKAIAYTLYYTRRLHTIFVTPSYYIVFVRTELTPFANQANTVRQRS